MTEKNVAVVCSTVRFLAVVFGMFVFLWFNATSFDQTKLKSIFGVALMAAAGEGITSVFHRAKG